MLDCELLNLEQSPQPESLNSQVLITYRVLLYRIPRVTLRCAAHALDKSSNTVRIPVQQAFLICGLQYQ